MKVLPARKMAMARAATAKISSSYRQSRWNSTSTEDKIIDGMWRHDGMFWKLDRCNFVERPWQLIELGLGACVKKQRMIWSRFGFMQSNNINLRKTACLGLLEQHCQNRNWKVKLSLETKTLPVDSKWSLGLIPFQACPLLQALSRKPQHMGGTFPKGPCSWINDG